VKALVKLYNQEKAAHEAGRVKGFVRANQSFREAYLAICKNELLARCLRLVDDQFELVRSRIHEDAHNRELTIAHEGRLVDAIAARNAGAASAEQESFLDFLTVYYSSSDATVSSFPPSAAT
jgi:DNA-binding GntR family transcriptional regulator